MSDYRIARYRDGRAYEGNQQFAGQGIKRSCAKCQQHKTSAGFKLVKPWGMTCKECQR